MVDNISDSGIKELMTRFKLIDIREQYMELIREAEKNSYSYKDFLISLLKVERDGIEYSTDIVAETNVEESKFGKYIIFAT